MDPRTECALLSKEGSHSSGPVATLWEQRSKAPDSSFFTIYSFVYLFLAALGLPCCTQAFSSCSEEGHSLVAVLRLLIALPFLVVKQGSRLTGLSSHSAQVSLPCSMRDPSSQARNRTCVPYISRRVLMHWVTREVPWLFKRETDTCEFLRSVLLLKWGQFIKKNAFESVLMRWLKLEPIIQSEVSQKEKYQYSILMHIYGI